MLKNVSLRDNQPGTKIVINFSIAVLTMLREFQYIKLTETFEILILFGTYRIFKQRRLSRVYANAHAVSPVVSLLASDEKKYGNLLFFEF